MRKQEPAELAKKVPFVQIFAQVPGVTKKEEQDRDITKVHWSIPHPDGERVLITAHRGNQESEWIVKDKGFPMEMPVTKFDLISELLFQGNLEQASSWVKSQLGQYSSSLIDLSQQLGISVDSNPSGSEADIELEELVEYRKRWLEADQRARRDLAIAKHSNLEPLPGPKVLSDWLKEPDDPVQYRIESLWPSDGTVFVVAQFKAGKTTLVSNLIASLTSGEPFLGRFTTTPAERNIGFLNFEVSPNQARRWLRETGIKNSEKVRVWNLRGYGSPFSTELMVEDLERSLKENEIEILIIDPFSGAFRNGNSKENDEVKAFLLELETIARRSGVREIVMTVHAGHDQDRVRGATTLGDHPDALWWIQKAKNGKRLFRAEGRDVWLDAEGLDLDPNTRRLRLTGLNKADTSTQALGWLILSFVRTSPGCTASQIEAGVTGKNSSITAARKRLVDQGVLIERSMGNSKQYYLAEVTSPPPSL